MSPFGTLQGWVLSGPDLLEHLGALTSKDGTICNDWGAMELGSFGAARDALGSGVTGNQHLEC